MIRCLATLLLLLNFSVLGSAPSFASGKEAKIIKNGLKQVQLFYSKAQYNKALDLARKLKTVSESVLSENHQQTLEAIAWVGFIYQAQGRYKLAEPLFDQSLRISRRINGRDHLDTIRSMLNLGSLYLYQARHNKSRAIFERALRISERKYGKEHPVTLIAVNNLANLYEKLGLYQKAEPMYVRALKFRERISGKDHVHTINSMSNLASFHMRLGRYAKAERLMKRALKAKERVHGKNHPDTIVSVLGLAAIYKDLGRYTSAERLYKRALATNRRILGEEHPSTLTGMNNLAGLYSAQGRYSQAEAYYKQILEVQERHSGLEHPATLISVTNLATVYGKTEQYVRAAALYKRALEASERKLGKNHPIALSNLTNLAVTYNKMGKKKLAEKMLNRAVKSSRRIFGSNHKETLSSSINLASLYIDQKRYNEAIPLYIKVLKGYQKIFGNDHPSTLISITNLAEAYREIGRLDEAQVLSEKVLRVRRRKLGKDHPDTIVALSNLAAKHFVKNEWHSAAELLDEATGSLIRRTRFVWTGQKTDEFRDNPQFELYLKSQYQVARNWQSRWQEISDRTFYRMQWTQAAGTSEILAQMASRFATGKGRLSSLIRERQDLVRNLGAKNKILEAAFSRSADRRSKAVEASIRKQIKTMQQRIVRIDKQLAKEFPDFTSLTRPLPLSVQEVRQQLQSDEALIYFYNTVNYADLPGETFIWLVTNTDFKWVRVPYGRAHLLKKVLSLRCGLDVTRWDNASYKTICNELLDTNHKKINTSDQLPFKTEIAHELYQILFGQIKEEIKGKKLLLVPHASLVNLPFQVLVTKQPAPLADYSQIKWLIQDHDLTVLPSVSSLRALRKTAKPSQARKPFIGIGNPLLTGPSGTDRRAWQKKTCPETFSAKVLRLAATAALDLKNLFRNGVNVTALKRQPPLPETADELCHVADILSADRNAVLLAEKATETNIKDLSSKGVLKNSRIIHFATHGLLANETKLFARHKVEPSLLLTPPDKATRKDDGLLMASEIAQLKLDADWVILSACNTAADSNSGGESMTGLAKAFFYAGARALLVSHWAVDSQATVALITDALRAQKKQPSLGRAGALSIAMQNMIKSKRSHPAYWAPFVVVGEGSYLGR